MFILYTDDPTFDPTTAVVITCRSCEKINLECTEIKEYCNSCCSFSDCSIHPLED